MFIWQVNKLFQQKLDCRKAAHGVFIKKHEDKYSNAEKRLYELYFCFCVGVGFITRIGAYCRNIALVCCIVFI